jgi:hypothetical protein
MERLSLLNPGLAWGALAVAIPVAIHLLSRRRSKKLPFAAVEFILRSKKQKTTNIRLRQLLLLALRALILGAVGLAIARPLLKPKAASAGGAGQHAATAIVLDASLSMRYRLDGKTLFARAQDEARALVDGLTQESPATVVVCDGKAPEAEPPAFDRVATKQRISGASAGYRPADVGACMGAAARALGQSQVEGKRIYVLSDLTAASIQLDSPPPKVPTPKGEVLPEVVFVDAARGAELPNVAVTDVAVTPSTALGTRGFDVVATLRNSGKKAANGLPISLRVGDRVVTRGFADVPAEGTARKLLAHKFEPGTQLATVQLEPDALEEDDARAFVLRVPKDVRALVADGSPSAIRYKDEAFFVEAALGPGRTAGRITATFLDADAAQSRSLADFDVVLLLNVQAPRPAFVEALKAFVANGGGLFLSAGEQVNPDDWNGAFGELLPRPIHLVRTAADPEEPGNAAPARFARVDYLHPAFGVFEGASEGFDSARIFRYLLLRPDAAREERVLATLDDGSPALIEARRGQGRVILYASTVDRDWTDWPIRTSFLPAMQQVTAYLAGGLDEKPPAASRVGDVRALALAEGTALAEVRGPDGRPAKVTEEGVEVALPGHHAVSVRDPQGARDAPQLSFAAVLDARESDTARLAQDALAEHFGGEEHAQVAGGAEGALPKTGTPLWSWLLFAAVLAFVAEGFVVRRT